MISPIGADERGSGREDYFLPDLCTPLPTLFLILSVELLVLVYVLAVSSLPDFRWDLFSFVSLFVLWVALLSAWLLCKSRSLFSKLSLPVAATASLGLVSLATLLSSAFIEIYLADIIGLPTGPWWLLRNLMIANILAAMLLRYFYLQQQLRLREKWALQARLDSLRARMRPHFLFNTLNSIASLINSRPGTAEQAIEDLAELLRASLQDSQDQATVEDEIQLTSRYLGIEALRLGDRLTVEWEIDPAVRLAQMPPLIIQPLVENAICHGIAQLAEGGHISIHIGGGPQLVHASVSNPMPSGVSPIEGNQMALQNIEQRLQAIYGPAASIHTHRADQAFHADIKYAPVQGVNSGALLSKD